jgi:hypothetical protein
MRIRTMKSFITLFLISVSLKLNAQTRAFNFTSTNNVVLKARGIDTNVKINKFLNFHIFIDEADSRSRRILIYDGKSFYESDYHIEYNIYSIQLKDNGDYYYWTKDLGQDGQTACNLVASGK